MTVVSDFLEWELRNQPLKINAWTADELINIINKILVAGDIEVQKKLFKNAKELFYKNGFTQSIDGWDGHWLGE
jgi:hypothetical protein